MTRRTPLAIPRFRYDDSDLVARMEVAVHSAPRIAAGVEKLASGQSKNRPFTQLDVEKSCRALVCQNINAQHRGN